MTSTTTAKRSVIVEREITFPPEKIWRALTQPHLIAEWLMKSDFKPVLGHGFKFTEDWGSIECRVTAIEPNRTLSYTWNAFGLESVVTWTLTATGTGMHLRMEQAGFPLEQEQAFRGATQAWPEYLSAMEKLLSTLD